MSPNLRKTFFVQKMVTIFQNSFFGEIQFSQKSLANRTKQPHTLPQAIVRQTLLQYPVTTSPSSNTGKKKLKFCRMGRAATGAHLVK